MLVLQLMTGCMQPIIILQNTGSAGGYVALVLCIVGVICMGHRVMTLCLVYVGTQLSEETRSLRGEIEQLQAEIKRKDQQIADLEQDKERSLEQMEKRNQTIADLQQELVSTERLQAQIQLKDRQIAELQRQVDGAGNLSQCTQLLSLSADIESWKVSRAEIQRIHKKQVGYGAWGVVYSGKFRGEDVAIKTAHREIFHESTVAMLKREVTIMSNIQHPNLVRFIAAVWDDAVERMVDTPIIISELMDMNLRDAYTKADLSSHLLPIFCDVAYALHYLHQHRQPIIHRDVSAPNVLLKTLSNGSYRAKVSDFGSANLVKQGKTAGIGAIVYSAPEMFPVEDISRPPQPQTTKVDVFSYGILLLEVISKEMPTQETRYVMLQKVEREWTVMHDLIVHCAKPSPSDRPTMANVLNKLNPMTQKYNV